MTVLETTS